MKPFKTIAHDANTKKQICEMLHCDLRNFNKLLYFDGEILQSTNDYLEYDAIKADELDSNDVLNHLRKLKNQQSEPKNNIVLKCKLEHTTINKPNYKLIEKDAAISALTNELKNLSKKIDDFAQSFK